MTAVKSRIAQSIPMVILCVASVLVLTYSPATAADSDLCNMECRSYTACDYEGLGEVWACEPIIESWNCYGTWAPADCDQDWCEFSC